VLKDVEVIFGELDSFGAHLAEKPMLMVASKIDAANKDRLAKLKQYCKKKKLQLFPISAVTGEGIEKLKFAMAEEVEEVRRATVQSSTDPQDHAQ
jgi:GTPase